MILYFTSTARFWAIAGVPYNRVDAEILRRQIGNLTTDADFLIHLGDIKAGRSSCDGDRFEEVRQNMELLTVPVLMVIGENEYNDCEDNEEALRSWRRKFAHLHLHEKLENSHRNENYNGGMLDVSIMPGRNESFYFVLKKTLFIGLNIVCWWWNMPGG